jgi:hypothetical protein
MSLHVFLLIFSLALLCFLCWPHHGPAPSRAATKVRSTLHRLLKPRCPHDCPACRLVSTPSSAAGPAPLPVRPWYEVKSRRGAPKRILTEGFACPNRQCLYFGNTDARVHAAFWGWQAWPCRADPDLSRSCLPRHLQCSTQHPLVSPENPLPAGRRGALGAG